MRAQGAAVQVGSIRAALSRALIEKVRFATDLYGAFPVKGLFSVAGQLIR
jgi:hypothetical protein